jgi:hypothetical protein
MPAWVVAAFKRQGARWGGDYRGRKDPMHFEFCQDAVPQGIIDLPIADQDADEPPAEIPTPPPKHDVAPDAPIPQPWWKKAWAWVSGGGIGTVGAALYDWRVAAIIAFVALVVFVVVWPTLRKKLEAL